MTSDAIIIALIAAVPGTLGAMAAIASLVASQRNGRKVDQLQINVDGRLQELLDQTASANRAQGKEEGVQQEKLTAAALASIPVPAPGSALEMKIINSPSEPIPTIITDLETDPKSARKTEKLKP